MIDHLTNKSFAIIKKKKATRSLYFLSNLQKVPYNAIKILCFLCKILNLSFKAKAQKLFLFFKHRNRFVAGRGGPRLETRGLS